MSSFLPVADLHRSENYVKQAFQRCFAQFYCQRWDYIIQQILSQSQQTSRHSFFPVFALHAPTIPPDHHRRYARLPCEYPQLLLFCCHSGKYISKSQCVLPGTGTGCWNCLIRSMFFCRGQALDVC